MKKPFYLLTFWAMIVLMGFCLTGCSTISNMQKDQEQKKKDIETKKELFRALKTDISNKTLRKGADAEALKEKYGEPDNVFNSGSNTGSFQVWTYNLYKDKLADNTLSNSIVLYIENDKLVNWKF